MPFRGTYGGSVYGGSVAAVYMENMLLNYIWGLVVTLWLGDIWLHSIWGHVAALLLEGAYGCTVYWGMCLHCDWGGGAWLHSIWGHVPTLWLGVNMAAQNMGACGCTLYWGHVALLHMDNIWLHCNWGVSIWLHSIWGHVPALYIGGMWLYWIWMICGCTVIGGAYDCTVHGGACGSTVYKRHVAALYSMWQPLYISMHCLAAVAFCDSLQSLSFR